MILHCDVEPAPPRLRNGIGQNWSARRSFVGGSPEKRGVVSAANSVARKYGVHSAMPAITARRLCPQGIYLPPRIDYYAEVSRQIRDILERFTRLMEPLSLLEPVTD